MDGYSPPPQQEPVIRKRTNYPYEEAVAGDQHLTLSTETISAFIRKPLLFNELSWLLPGNYLLLADATFNMRVYGI